MEPALDSELHKMSVQHSFSYSVFSCDFLKRIQQLRPAHLAKYVTVVLDEMYSVCQRRAGVCDINNIIHDAKSRFKNHDNSHRPLAKVMLVFIIYVLFSPFKYSMLSFQLQIQKELTYTISAILPDFPLINLAWHLSCASDM